MQYFKLSLLIAGALVIAGTVQVQEAIGQSEDGKLKTILEAKFDGMDQNKNGSISQREFVARNKENLIKTYMGLDQDKNGEVSGKEFVSIRVKMGEPEAQAVKDFEALDSNGNGSYDTSEAVSYIDNHLTSQFKAWDVNGDGELTKDEFVTSAMKELKSAQQARAEAQK